MKDMKDVSFIPGVWDLLHTGHIKFLERAKKLTDVTIVGVESDELINEEKGYYPAIELKDRILALENIKYVDIVIPFTNFDYVSYMEQYNANTLILSDNYINSNAERFVSAIKYIKENKKRIIYLPYSYGISSTEIKNKILDQNIWKDIWNKIGSSKLLDDIQVNSDSLTEKKIEHISNYFINKLQIRRYEKVLDFGCGSGLILKSIDQIMKRISKNINSIHKNKTTILPFGIDISEGMIQRAVKNCPDGIFIVYDHIPFKNTFDHIISYGVLHYMQTHNHVSQLLEEMKNLSNSILIMEIPDIEKKEQREINRNKLSKQKYPEQLYFSKDFFVSRGFQTFDNEISVTNNSDFGFTALYKR